MSENIDDFTKDYLQHVFRCFSPGIHYACAYGSGIFKQSGHKSIKDNMIDFIFVVDDAFSWHYKTLQRYPHHYSFLKMFGAERITDIQNNYGANVYFNTCVEFDGRLIKYGVLELKHFSEDMYDWKSMYIAGRLHKPVHVIKDSSDRLPIQTNLKSALYTALLLLPEKFDKKDLYLKIAGLSYTGDPRMVVGEDKGKVNNIVTGNLEGFNNLYNLVLHGECNIHVQNSTIQQDLDPDVQLKLAMNLPKCLKTTMSEHLNIPVTKSELFHKKMTDVLSDRKELENTVLKSVGNIVRRSSTTQTLKNSATAGFSKSLFYSAQKFRKMLKGFRR